MDLIFLGTGTSVGIPMIGCSCPVCTSSDPRNTRSRSSLYISTETFAFVIDTSPDFRNQMLRHNIRRCQAVLFTHAHADHIFGFDDIRRFNTIHQTVLPAYAEAPTLRDLRRAFHYIDDKPSTLGLYRAQIDFKTIESTFTLGDVTVTPLRVTHHGSHMTGYLLEHGQRRMAYIPDCSELPDETVERLCGIDCLILDCLRYRPHPAHLNVERSLAYIQRIAPTKAYLTHLCHDIDHATLEATLPPHIRIAYDGLTLHL